ncbi:hypothetical protein ONZ51_g13019 [Trametes cubensis]|uniref:Uncharacterized protein n=1 Tax=Trametes cubensis TaxID=1111947 RepID=A0AAD7TF52_9APHY|nr:hypothetical protein ONZ51_g13019 [Trametes cubensis]
MKIPYSTSPSEPLNLAARDDASEEPLLLTLTLTVTLDPDATPSAVQTFSSPSDRSRDAVPTPTSTDASTMAETSPVVTQAASSSMSTSDASTVAAVASVVAVLIFVTSLVLYVLCRAHRRWAKASRARIECWNSDAKHARFARDSPNPSRSLEAVEARMSPDYSLDKAPSQFSDDHPAGDLYDGSIIYISPDGPFATPYHARLPSTISIPPAVQPIRSETTGENIRVSPVQPQSMKSCGSDHPLPEGGELRVSGIVELYEEASGHF